MLLYGECIFFSTNLPCFTNRVHFSPLKAAYIRLIYYIILCKGIQIWTMVGDRFLLNLIKINITTLVDVSSCAIFADSISKTNWILRRKYHDNILYKTYQINIVLSRIIKITIKDDVYHTKFHNRLEFNAYTKIKT